MKKLRFVVLLLEGVLLLFFTSIEPLFAQSLIDNNSSNPSLTLYPSVNLLTISKNTTVVKGITLKNNSSVDSAISVSDENFFNADSKGDISFSKTKREGIENPVQWITFDNKPQLFKAHGKITIPLTFTIPKEIHEGGYYVAVFFQQSPITDSQGDSTLFPRVGSLFFISVPGNDTVKASIQDQEVQSNIATSLPLSKSNKLAIDTYFTNTGNVHVETTGKIVISDFFHHTIKSLQMVDHIVLPNATRKITTEWKNPSFPIMGFYRIRTSISYGGKLTTFAQTYFVFPYYLLCLIGLILIGVIISVVELWKAIKKSFPKGSHIHDLKIKLIKR